MKYCEKCGSEMKTRNFALHLLTLTFKIGIPMAIIGAFTMDFIMSLGVNCIYIIPYLSLVLYPFKLGVVHKCTNDDCKEVEYDWTEKFSCSSCGEDVKRHKKTVKMTLLGTSLMLIMGLLVFIDYDGFFGISKTLLLCGLGLNILAAILEKAQVYPVILKCKSCGKGGIAKEEKVTELGL